MLNVFKKGEGDMFFGTLYYIGGCYTRNEMVLLKRWGPENLPPGVAMGVRGNVNGGTWENGKRLKNNHSR